MIDEEVDERGGRENDQDQTEVDERERVELQAARREVAPFGDFAPGTD